MGIVFAAVQVVPENIDPPRFDVVARLAGVTYAWGFWRPEWVQVSILAHMSVNFGHFTLLGYLLSFGALA